MDHRFKIGMIATAIGLALLLGWLVYQHVTGPNRLLKQARRDSLLGHEDHVARLRERTQTGAIRQLNGLSPDETTARLGLTRLLAGFRYWQVAEAIDSEVLPRVQRAMSEPDDSLAEAVISAYLAEPSTDARGQILTVVSSLVDFRFFDQFLRGIWEGVPESRRGELVVGFSRQLSMASPPDNEAVDASSGWSLYPAQEREQIQSEMRKTLHQWMLPTLESAAEGRNVPPGDAASFRYLLNNEANRVTTTYESLSL